MTMPEAYISPNVLRMNDCVCDIDYTHYIEVVARTTERQGILIKRECRWL